MDIQNFESAFRICETKVISCLAEYVPGSKGTQQYLRLMYMTIYALLQKKFSVKKDYYLWYTVFFCKYGICGY